MMNKQNNTTSNNHLPSGGRGAYNFLFKPVFFIFSLLFATWLVLYIERLAPSDFGRYESIFSSKPKSFVKAHSIQNDKLRLKKIGTDYKAGLIDSAKFERELEVFLKSSEH